MVVMMVVVMVVMPPVRSRRRHWRGGLGLSPSPSCRLADGVGAILLGTPPRAAAAAAPFPAASAGAPIPFGAALQ